MTLSKILDGFVFDRQIAVEAGKGESKELLSTIQLSVDGKSLVTFEVLNNGMMVFRTDSLSKAIERYEEE